jgi:hypothetical protein
MGMCLEAVKTLKLLRQKGQSFIAVLRDSPGVTRFYDRTEAKGFLITFLTGSGFEITWIGSASSFCFILEVLCLLNF